MGDTPSFRDTMRGGAPQPPPVPAPGQDPQQFHAQQQTDLLREIAGGVATMKNIAVFFTILWGIGALLLFISILGR